MTRDVNPHGATASTGILETGTFVVSIDVEMAWGVAHRPAPDEGGHDYAAEREVIDRILEVFARYQVAATWAVVGHLFLDGCQAEGAVPHPDVVRPAYSWLDRDWFAIDPCSTVAEAPHWYGPDIVDAILACPVHQEVASHSFSHVIVDDPGCSPEAFGSELAAAVEVAAERDVELRSFVYPRNAVAQIERLGEHGFRCYRGGRPSVPFAGHPTWQRRFLAALDHVRPLAGSAARPARHPSGVWNIPQTYLFNPTTSGRRLPPALWSRPAVARLEQAARERSLFHLWFHPYNITAAPDPTIDALDRICAAATRLRDHGRLDIVPMGALAERLEASM